MSFYKGNHDPLPTSAPGEQHRPPAAPQGEGMIDTRHIGHRFTPFDSVIEAGRVRLFCQAIGETAAIHFDARAARAAGYPDIVAPLTFPAAIAMDNPNPHCVIDLLGVEIARILHSEERYDYLAPICVGDRITTGIAVMDIYTKKNGALQFVVTSLEMHNALGQPVCKVRRSFVVRQPSGLNG
jgi:acyl dehydratase